MAKRSGKQTAPGEWQYTVGEVPLQLTAYERKDNSNHIYTRVWDGKRIRSKAALCPPIRDERGRIIPEREIEAQQATVKRHATLRSGLSAEDVATGPLTLGAGFRKVLHQKDGKYVGQSDHIRDMTRYSNRILAILGNNLHWNHVRHAHYRKLWRELAEQSKKSDYYGLRQADQVVGLLQSASRWLQAEGYTEPGSALPAPGWKQTMVREWEEIVRRPPPKLHQPRYTEEESARLWAALAAPGVDPRLWLGMEIGAELRLGQVPRSHRSDITWTAEGELYAVEVHGKGKKKGEVVVLTPEQAGVLRYHMATGYLRRYEEEHQAGRMADYPLLPGGYLHYWEKGRKLPYPVAPMENADHTATDTQLKGWWKKLESAAGVPHMEGRRWYGMRRLQSDLAEDVETDARVLNKMGAWTHTATRERYQEKGRTRIQEKAAVARRKIRPGKHLPDTEQATDE